MKKLFVYTALLVSALVLLIAGCEKEIEVSVPLSQEQLVVEASINTFSPILNYVFITKSVDYFKPDLTLGGLEGASVTVTEGQVIGTDTFYSGPTTPFFNVYDASRLYPEFDTLFRPYDSIVRNLKGFYLNPAFMGKENTPYLLLIRMADGRLIEGKTFIPKAIRLDTIKYEIRGNPDDSGRYDAFTTLYWVDPPGQDNYRMAIKKGYFSPILIGWGAADSYRTFDDEFLNNLKRSYSFFRPHKTQDTLSIYFSTIGRKEFLFWQSFGQASNSSNPFSTPVELKSNLKGAIGTFTGYAVDFHYLIIGQ